MELQTSPLGAYRLAKQRLTAIAHSYWTYIEKVERVPCADTGGYATKYFMPSALLLEAILAEDWGDGKPSLTRKQAGYRSYCENLDALLELFTLRTPEESGLPLPPPKATSSPLAMRQRREAFTQGRAVLRLIQGLLRTHLDLQRLGEGRPDSDPSAAALALRQQLLEKLQKRWARALALS